MSLYQSSTGANGVDEFDSKLRVVGTVLQNGVLTVAADAAATLTAAQLLAGFIEGPITAARTYTTDTAANLDLAYTNPQVNDAFMVQIVNTSAGAFAITLAAGTGVTLKGSAVTIAQAKMATLYFKRTAAAAWTCYVSVSA